MSQKNKTIVAVLCGGPSLERGISMNSARSVLDHLGSLGVDIIPIYFNEKRKAFKISTAQLYSNTPSDFDFKLATSGKELSNSALVKILKSVNIVFPCIHGTFGEDGEIQAFLEKNKIPFIGSSSKSCKIAFDKYRANEYIRSVGFYAPNSIVLKITDTKKEITTKITKFWKNEKITRAIVKPASGGSSIGVFSVEKIKDAVESVEHLFSKRIDTRVVLEPFALGQEFTVIILQNRFNIPVAILPTEIEVNYGENQFFDFRKKYLPTRQVKYHCPPRFPNEIIEKIQIQAEQLFSLFGMADFARFDGFLMPDGNIWFSDFNPISGMEQNSFLFQQSSRIGFSHQDLLRYVVNNAFLRREIPVTVENIFLEKKIAENKERKPLAVLFGGSTSEKQVSLMSGTNVWLKLRGSMIYKPYPYLLGKDGEVWELPYSYILNHTVEEIIENAETAENDLERLSFLIEKVKIKLCLHKTDTTEEFFIPKKYSLEELLRKYKFIFLALHGGVGEDGTIQKMLEDKRIEYNGSDSVVSRLCMDKWLTNEIIKNANIKGVSVAPHILLNVKSFKEKNWSLKDFETYWNMLQKKLETKTIIVKPRGDGCSSGVARLYNKKDLENYISLIKDRKLIAPPFTFTNQSNSIDMPEGEVTDIIFESYIETDKLKVNFGKIIHTRKNGYLEMTVGVIERDNKMKALSPSITVVEASVLSVEEKFQGGTGVNITPPPTEIISTKNLNKVKKLVEEVAKKIGIRGYARIDIFTQIQTGNIILIEVNTLPGLTPSTVIYHQALAEKEPIFPKQFLELLIQTKKPKLSAIKRIENEAHKIGGVVSLAQGIPSIGSNEIIRKTVIEAIKNGEVDKYSLSAGLPELQDLIFKKLKLNEKENGVIVTAGAIEALSAIFLAHCHKGDEVITFSPYYSAYLQVVGISGARLISEPLCEEKNWRPNLKSLREKINKNTKVIFLCNPHNPTGIIFTREELEEIGHIALENNLLIISDDVYKNFYFTKEKPYLLQDDPIFKNNLINVVSLSKDFSLSGWRIGFLFGSKKLLEPIYSTHDTLVNCAPVASQYAALAALKYEANILPNILMEYREHRKIMGKYLEELSSYLDFVWPDGSYYFFPKIKNLKDSEKFCFDMVTEAKIAAVPGSSFGKIGEGHIRLCFGRSKEDIIEGMKRFKKYLIKWSKSSK
jgi:D-alanine--D-alanine ligase